MNFGETVARMGYEIFAKDSETILIRKQYELASIFILFDNKNKEISGAIRTDKLIYNLDEIANHYSIFRDMKADLKTFQQLSHYDIID